MMFWKYFAIKSQLVCFIRVVELGNYSGWLFIILSTVDESVKFQTFVTVHSVTQ